MLSSPRCLPVLRSSRPRPRPRLTPSISPSRPAASATSYSFCLAGSYVRVARTIARREFSALSSGAKQLTLSFNGSAGRRCSAANSDSRLFWSAKMAAAADRWCFRPAKPINRPITDAATNVQCFSWRHTNLARPESKNRRDNVKKIYICPDCKDKS